MSTVQLLPPLTPTTFQHRLDKVSYPYYSIEAGAQVTSAVSSTSVASASFARPRQTSPASIFSAASAPLPYNNENIAPIQPNGLLSQPQSRLPSADRPGTDSCAATRCRSPRVIPTRPSTSAVPTSVAVGADDSHKDEEKDDLLKAALEDLENYRNAKCRRSIDSVPRTKAVEDPSSTCDTPRPDTALKPTNVGPRIAARVTDVSDVPCTPLHIRSAIETTSSDNASNPPLSPLHLRSRHSTSSGLVHTIKTASFSNLSFSVISKRLRYGQSSESRRFFGSHSRFSTDSDRPATMSSIDENALWRGVKRRRIIEELVITEESYVADLKALVYLMSTLLASATSLPNRVRKLVQRNILDLLHIHESLVESLHRAAFKAAARKWADTLAPRALTSPRHIRWRSLDSQVTYRPSLDHGTGGGSGDAGRMSRTRAKLVGTEPTDLAEIMSMFRKALHNFYAYEEYCANHEIIAHDLQRHLPNLWSSYGSGMESLARSLTALDKKDDGGRKALTVGDLLIKPIQRICKYPLLFEELLSYTPVSDDPMIHAEVDGLLHCLRDVVESVNAATQNPETRLQIHKRWSLRAHLSFERVHLTQEDLRSLGNALLCGVLHLTYQTRHGTTGSYALCVLFSQGLLVAFPIPTTPRFDVVAFIQLQDLKVDSASDGKGK